MRIGTYRAYLLGLLTVIFTFNLLDRVALGILLQDIKLELLLTDTQLGLLTGIAFALFYSVMGIPIARWADRGNRVTIIALTTTLWSAAVALCGMASSFLQLLLIRVGVAVGEAGCSPPAFSLIADHFARGERPRATAIYGMGGSVATVVGFFMAGWLNSLYGWRVAFMLLAIPGFALAALAAFTLREPRRMAPSLVQPEPVSSPAMMEVARTLWANRTFRHLLLCLSVVFFFVNGVLQWQPTFFIRSHGLTTLELGTWMSLTWGISGLLGCYLGGEAASRYAAQNESLQLRLMAAAVAISGVLSMFVYLSQSLCWALALLGMSVLFLGTVNGPLFSTIQTLVPERMRAVAFALVYLVANLVGMGFGPLLVGILSDALRPWAGEDSLRYALLMLSPGCFWAAWHALRASHTVTRDVGATGHWNGEEPANGVFRA